MLSKGGFSEVYRCKHKGTNEVFILKKIKTDAMAEAKIPLLLLGEIEIMITLRESPFSIELVDYFVYANDLYLVCEYCNGGDLDDYVRKYRIKEQKTLSLEELKLIAWNIACGLRDMHKQNLIHRDVKPKNILLIKAKGNSAKNILDVKMCDFG
jgi:serine/threonine protein kinase